VQELTPWREFEAGTPVQLQQESLVSFQRKREEKILPANNFLITRTVTPQTIQQRLGKADLFTEEILIFLDESDGITSLSFSYHRSRALSSFRLPDLLSVAREHPCVCVCRRLCLPGVVSPPVALLPVLATGHPRVPRRLLPRKATRGRGAILPP